MTKNFSSKFNFNCFFVEKRQCFEEINFQIKFNEFLYLGNNRVLFAEYSKENFLVF